LDWYVTAVAAAVFYAAQMLGLRRLQKSYPIPVYMAYVWLGAGATIGLLFIRTTETLNPLTLPYVVGAALGSWAGMYAVNRAIALQPNVGYVDAVGTLRLGLIYGVSIVLFGAVFEPFKLAALAGGAVGVVLIVGLRRNPSVSTDRRWVAWLLFSVLCFTALFACIRMATERGLDARAATSLIMLIAGGLYVATALRGGHSLQPSADGAMILLTIVFSAIGNIAFFTSLVSAPNLAYTDAVVNLRLIILYAAALIMGADRLQPVRALGVAITFGCAVLLG
jgi:drug/metabolite transporter (DMT)-like permease